MYRFNFSHDVLVQFVAVTGHLSKSLFLDPLVLDGYKSRLRDGTIAVIWPITDTDARQAGDRAVVVYSKFLSRCCRHGRPRFTSDRSRRIWLALLSTEVRPLTSITSVWVIPWVLHSTIFLHMTVSGRVPP